VQFIRSLDLAPEIANALQLIIVNPLPFDNKQIIIRLN
jgi:hypothetical protein